MQQRAVQGAGGQIAVEQYGRGPFRGHTRARHQPPDHRQIADARQNQGRAHKGDQHQRVEHHGQAEEQNFIDVEHAGQQG